MRAKRASIHRLFVSFSVRWRAGRDDRTDVGGRGSRRHVVIRLAEAIPARMVELGIKTAFRVDDPVRMRLTRDDTMRLETGFDSAARIVRGRICQFRSQGTMRKLVEITFMSLDGVIDAPDLTNHAQQLTALHRFDSGTMVLEYTRGERE